MNCKPQSGDVYHIISYLKEFPFCRKEGNNYIFGDDEKEYHDYNLNVNSKQKWTPEWGLAAKNHEFKWANKGSFRIHIWTNRYGWACGSVAHKKLDSSLVSKGSNLEDCIAFIRGLILNIEHKCFVLSVNDLHLPEEVKCFLLSIKK